jgi:protein-serine/threonine kinase
MAVAHATYTPQSTWSSTEKHHATEKEIAKSNQQSPASSISSRSSTRSSEYISGNDNTKIKQDVKSSKLHLGLVGKKLFQNNTKPATTESSHNVQSTHKVAAVPKSPASSVKSSTSLLKKYGTCDKRSCIGRGATAVVRLVHKMDRKDSSDKLYAVKEFRKRRKNESEKEYMKKLTGEFCISSTFQHPNVVETVDLVLDDQQRYCTVMEYCPGGDLDSAIKAQFMDLPSKECCFKQMINGVAYLHSMGVAHRDIKPENLLLDQTGCLKICDFGVSDVFRMCWERKPHLSSGITGSEPYIAPEVFAQKEYDAAKVDVWSCAIVFHCMLFDGIPWRIAKKEESNYNLFLKTRESQSYDTFKTLSPECKDLLYRMLDTNPETRISMPEILEHPYFKSIQACRNGFDSLHQEHHHVNLSCMNSTLRK